MLSYFDFTNVFQSTRSHGARPKDADKTGLPNDCFNPRAHTERDGFHVVVVLTSNSFNPRAHTERDPKYTEMLNKRQSFNPRAHTERDFPGSIKVGIDIMFQSTRSHGARPV